MRFFIDASLPRSTADVLRAEGHEAVDARELGMAAAPDSDIAAHARAAGMCLLSRDFDFADMRIYPPELYAGIVVFELPNEAGRERVLSLVRGFVRQKAILDRLPGRLAIVEAHRTRLRPA